MKNEQEGRAAPGLADPLDRRVYPADPWRLVEMAPPANPAAAATIFALGNGFVGLRGECDETAAAGGAACFVNGFYETWPIHYPEDAYGLARQGQTIQAAPNASRWCLRVMDAAGRAVPAEQGEVVSQQRQLDLAAGVLHRQTVWRVAGHLLRVEAQRLVSFSRPGLVASQVTLTALGQAAEVEIWQGLAAPAGGEGNDGGGHVDGGDGSGGWNNVDGGGDPRRATALDGPAPEIVLCQAAAGGDGFDARLALGLRTVRAGRCLAVVADHRLDGDGAAAGAVPLTAADGSQAGTTWRVTLAAGQSVRLTVLAWYEAGGDAAGITGLAARAADSLNQAVGAGWPVLVAEQRTWLDDFWVGADIVVGDDALQQAVRWSLYQAIQATACADGAGVAAKGVTGSGYDGHYFWDMETYVMPFLTFTRPDVAKAVLAFRQRTLPQARQRAAELGLAGALFPWRTIDGREASAFFEAGTAQYHIDADIAYALTHYVAASGDESVLAGGGFDILVETARLWASLGFWGDDGYFHLHCVTGPDEYTALVDDNLYTNVMARANLRAAAAAVERWGAALATAELDCAGLAGEATQWRRIADGMFVPYDEARGLHPQDAGFLQRQRWDLAAIPPQNFPLLLHYHPLTIYRHQVLKQADVVLAQILCPDDFSPAQKRADFDYYDPLTTGDSTLSAVPQAIAAAEAGYLELAGHYLAKAAFVDLADSHHNTDAGVHVAVAAGVWGVLVAGFGGLREVEGQLRLAPCLPPGCPVLKFSLCWQGSRLSVTVTPGQAELTASGPVPVPLTVWGQAVVVSPGQTTYYPEPSRSTDGGSTPAGLISS